MDVIIPAAQREEGKPKYLNYDYDGNLMIKNAILPFAKHNISIGILKDHDLLYGAKEILTKELSFVHNLDVVILQKNTNGPAETVYNILKETEIDDSPIFIKDCDTFFDCGLSSDNFICVSRLSNQQDTKNIMTKSFVTVNEHDIIMNIVEKRVVSDTFCVGGYGFESARSFLGAYEELKQDSCYISHVVQKCLSSDIIFQTREVHNYIDVGTEQEWHEYNDKPVIFCDVDGTVIKAQSRHGPNSYNSPPEILVENVKVLLRLAAQGAQIIFVTSRPIFYNFRTHDILRELGFKDFSLIVGLKNSRRILINDYNKQNPYPRAEAINILRDSDTLKDFIS
jgi:hypothetical protein